MTKEERRALLQTIRKGDTIIVRHGTGTMSAHVVSANPILVVRKITKNGHKMQPTMFSTMDVISRVGP